MITGAEIIVKCLEKENVTTIFGYPGAAICPFYDSLLKSDIKHILVRQEQNAVHCASGYARSSSEVGVCVATSGPGATNLITGIATAYMDSIPIVAITGQVRSDLLGRDVFQEADITGACEPFVKHSYLVNSTEELPRIFKEAFHIARTGRPGPVLIDIPINYQQNKIDKFVYPERAEIIGYKPKTTGHILQIKKALEALNTSKKPLICAGGGVLSSDSSHQLIEFVEKTKIPLVSTMMGIGVLPAEHPLYLGMMGSFGKYAANKALNETDLLLVFGARLGDRAVASKKQISDSAKIIHIDIDPAEIGKNIKTTVPLVGDISKVLTEISSMVEYVTQKSWIDTINDWKQLNNTENKSFEGYVEPKSFIRKFNKLLPEKSILVSDVGQNQIWCANNYCIKDGRFLTTGGMGTMGYSIPAGIGAKLAQPNSEVVVVCGDGSFQMSMSELAVIAQQNLNIKIIIMRNKRLGMVRELQDKQYDSRYSGVFLDETPDFMKIAEAYNIPCKAAFSNEEAIKYTNEMLKSDGSFILVCNVHPDTPSI